MSHLAVNRSGFLKVNIVLNESGAKPVTIRNVARYSFLGRFFMWLGYASELLITKDNEVKKYYVNTKSFLKHFGQMASISKKQLKDINVKNLKKIDYDKVQELYKKSTSSIIQPAPSEPSITIVQTHPPEGNNIEVEKLEESQTSLNRIEPVTVTDQQEDLSTDDSEVNSSENKETQPFTGSVLHEEPVLLHQEESEIVVNHCKVAAQLSRREKLLLLATGILSEDEQASLVESSVTEESSDEKSTSSSEDEQECLVKSSATEKASDEETLNDRTSENKDGPVLGEGPEIDNISIQTAIEELSRVPLTRIRSKLDLKSFFEENEDDDIDHILDTIEKSPLLRERSQKLIKEKSLLAIQKLFTNPPEPSPCAPPATDENVQSTSLQEKTQLTTQPVVDCEFNDKRFVNFKIDEERHFKGYYLPAENILNGRVRSPDKTEKWEGEWKAGVFMKGFYTTTYEEGGILKRVLFVDAKRSSNVEWIYLRNGQKIRRNYKDNMLFFVHKFNVEGELYEKIHYGMVESDDGYLILDAIFRESGKFNENNELEGLGSRADLKKGKKFRGTFSNGIMNGPFNIIDSQKGLVAICEYRDDRRLSFYVGAFDTEGNAHGSGAYINANGDSYEGTFDTGMYNGEFTVTYHASKEKAKGTFIKNLKTGIWTTYTPEGHFLYDDRYDKGQKVVIK